jgi:hypothetical protein
VSFASSSFISAMVSGMHCDGWENSTPIACLLIFGGPAEPALLLLLLLSFLFEHESGFVCSNMDGVVT